MLHCLRKTSARKGPCRYLTSTFTFNKKMWNTLTLSLRGCLLHNFCFIGATFVFITSFILFLKEENGERLLFYCRCTWISSLQKVLETEGEWNMFVCTKKTIHTIILPSKPCQVMGRLLDTYPEKFLVSRNSFSIMEPIICQITIKALSTLTLGSRWNGNRLLSNGKDPCNLKELKTRRKIFGTGKKQVHRA